MNCGVKIRYFQEVRISKSVVAVNTYSLLNFIKNYARDPDQKATTPKLKRRKRSRKRQDFILYSYNVINEESSYFITDMASSNGALFMTYDDGIFNGTDLFLGSGSKTALKEWKSNIAFRNRIREATHRVLYVTANYSMAMNGLTANSIIVSVMPWWQLVLIIAIIAFGAISLISLLLYIIQMRKN